MFLGFGLCIYVHVCLGIVFFGLAVCLPAQRYRAITWGGTDIWADYVNKKTMRNKRLVLRTCLWGNDQNGVAGLSALSACLHDRLLGCVAGTVRICLNANVSDMST